MLFFSFLDFYNFVFKTFSYGIYFLSETSIKENSTSIIQPWKETLFEGFYFSVR